jgi:carboxypeptidase Taq
MQQCAPELGDTFSDDGASMGMHESQSRFYENIIGRSREFWEVHYPKLVEFFPEQLKGVTVDNFVAFVNRAENSFIRIEADELTYPLHIMLRYDIEKRVVSGELAAKDLPAVWNAKMQEYFGITPPTDKQGVLQDIHWAGGSFGYFPTYALGSAIGCQLFAAMNKDFDVLGSLKSGNTQQINDWLREKIHKYGATKYPMDILRDATGEDFDAKYFIEYLIDKYSRLYNI